MMIVAPLFIYLMWKYTKWGTIATAVWLVVMMAIPGIHTAVENLPPIATTATGYFLL